jgi:hypothetical protein
MEVWFKKILFLIGEVWVMGILGRKFYKEVQNSRVKAPVV